VQQAVVIVKYHHHATKNPKDHHHAKHHPPEATVATVAAVAQVLQYWTNIVLKKAVTNYPALDCPVQQPEVKGVIVVKGVNKN
tara:strand:- start:229 stop:477 length:249 start_codon:yes stop_codon:yes gene_type:complete